MIIPVLLLLLLQAPAQEEKPLVTDDELLEIVREAIPAVERATGVKFRIPVWARVSSRGDVERTLVEEFIPQMRILEPSAGPEEAPKLAQRYAKLYGSILIAKYAWKKGVIHIVPESFRTLAKTLERPALLDRNVLRVIVTHELVHALDYQEYDLLRDLSAAKTLADLEIRNAISEGHAQHVTRRVFDAAGELAAFETYEQCILAGPPSLGEAERYLASVMTASLKLAYVDGRAFFDALEKTGRKTYVQDVFRNPPARKNVILRPEEFYNPKPESTFNPAAAFEPFGKEFGPEWSRRVQELDQATLKATFGSFIEAKDVEAALKGILEGHALVLNPKADPQGKLVAVALVRTESAEAAKRIFEASVQVSKAKDKRFTGTPFKITKAEYGALALPGEIPNVLIRKRIAVQDRELAVTSVVGLAGDFEFELVLSNEEADDARLRALVAKLLEGLRGK